MEQYTNKIGTKIIVRFEGNSELQRVRFGGVPLYISMLVHMTHVAPCECVHGCLGDLWIVLSYEKWSPPRVVPRTIFGTIFGLPHTIKNG